MENASTLIRPSPPPQPLPPPFLAASPLSFFDNATNGTTIGTPPPQLLVPMDNSNITLFMPPAAFTDEPRRVDLSLIELILALMAVIMLPALIYAFFFAVKFPPWPNSLRNHQQSSDELPTDNIGGPGPGPGARADRVPQPVPGVKYQKESHVKEIGSDCPVCLSVFADGEEVRQLTACKHAFHTTCIDSWLNNHSSCPICRASVTVKKPSGRTAAPRERDCSMHQGGPDAASLV